MKCFTEFDEIQDALSRVRMDENVMPYVNGRLVENVTSYNKIQKLLNASEMASSHKYLYNLDVESLDEEEIEKIDKLFDLAVKNGYIDNSFEEEIAKEECPDAVVQDEECPECAQQTMQQTQSVPSAGWTILYSAVKDGETKCGQCFSNAISVSAAKADCLAKLDRFGYSNITILAIEAGDPDACQICEDGKNPYTAGMKVVTGKVATEKTKPVKKIKEDDEDTDDSDADDSDADDSDITDTEPDGDSDNTDDSNDSDDDSNVDDDSESDSEDNDDDDDSKDEDSESEDDSESDSEDDDNDSEDDDNDSEDDDNDSEDDSEDDDEKEDLDDAKKSELRDEYKRIFKEVMLACEYEDKSFNDLTIEEKVKFFEKLNDKWQKNEPNEFMSDDEQDQLESVVCSKD